MYLDVFKDLPSLNAVISSAKTIYSLGASISFYMIHGGTNFGFWNGAEPTGPVGNFHWKFIRRVLNNYSQSSLE